MNTPLAEITDSVEPLLADVISAFIAHPDQLHINCARMGGKLQFNIDAHPDDLPKIAGKLYGNLSALQVIFTAILKPVGFAMRIHLEDRSRERSRDANTAPFTNNPNWPREDFTGLLQDVLNALCANPPRVTENIVEPRKLRFGTRTVNGAEESIFNIEPTYNDLPVFTTDVEVALELIFRAIGQQQGRRITINFTNAQQGST